MENIISEFRVIETDDGFRIEIKGDKEQIKSFINEFGTGKNRHHRRGFGFGWGPWMMHPKMWTKMARCWPDWDDESESEPETNEV